MTSTTAYPQQKPARLFSRFSKVRAAPNNSPQAIKSGGDLSLEGLNRLLEEIKSHLEPQPTQSPIETHVPVSKPPFVPPVSYALPNARTPALDPDFLALGMGGTGMMAMIWTVAMGHRAVGVELRGDPFLGVHWNIREDLYHQLGIMDQMMLDQYGEDGVPRCQDGRIFSLADCFYSSTTKAGDIVTDEIIDGFTPDQHVVGTISHIEYIDDRWKDGKPNRFITLLTPPVPPSQPDPAKIRTDMTAVLDGPSLFQAEARSVLILLRRYLEAIEKFDVDRGHEPRVRIFNHHRVVPDETGLVTMPDGRLRIRIEELHELDTKGKFIRIRSPGSTITDIGVPELFMVAQGSHSTDAERLGFAQKDVMVDHGDGRGAFVAQADYVAGLVEILVDGRLRRRIASEFDENGEEHWVRQIAVGHENDPEVGWILVQVPDFLSFDPIERGKVARGTDPQSPEYFAAHVQLLYDFFIEHAAAVLDIPKEEVKKTAMIYGPKLFSLVERKGDSALLALNGVVAGDSFGNGHFMTSGGAMTGMIGHAGRVLAYWQSRADGMAASDAIDYLAYGINEDTDAWLKVSATEFTQAIPVNFGAERGKQIAAASGINIGARNGGADATKRSRHALIPLNPSDWRRLVIRPGRTASSAPLHPLHPAARKESTKLELKRLSRKPTQLRRLHGTPVYIQKRSN